MHSQATLSIILLCCGSSAAAAASVPNPSMGSTVVAQAARSAAVDRFQKRADHYAPSFLSIPRGGGRDGKTNARVVSSTPTSSKKKALETNARVVSSTPTSSKKKALEVRPTSGGDASVQSEIFNLVKTLVGVGVLSLPAGIGAFGDAPGALLPAVFLIAGIGILSGYGFSLIGRVCAYTGTTSYRSAWEQSLGPTTSWIPAASCTCKTFLAILACSMVLADTFQSLLSTLGITASRTNTLIGVTTLVLLPLCLLKNLSSLAPFSLLGIIGMGYTAIAMATRYLDGMYSAPDGSFLADVPIELQPTFCSRGASSVLSPSAFILICMLSTAYMAHFNAPKFYTELKDNTIERFNTVVASSFGASIVIQGIIAGLGFLTFGGASSGSILNNYSTKDKIMGLSRFTVAFSIVFSYPLAFMGCRNGILDMAQVPQEKRTDSLTNNLTLALLGVVTAAAIQLKNLSFVLSFGGATLGNALIYVYPALMFRSAVEKMGDDANPSLKREVHLASAFAVLGIGFGIVGAKMALEKL